MFKQLELTFRVRPKRIFEDSDLPFYSLNLNNMSKKNTIRTKLTFTFRFVVFNKLFIFWWLKSTSWELIVIAVDCIVINQTFWIVSKVNTRLSMTIHTVILNKRIGCSTAGYPRSCVFSNVIISNVGTGIINQYSICILHYLIF